MSAAFEETAWSWVDHLRHGGVTGWADWVAASPVGAPVATNGALPGAAQLEFVRRLAEAGPPGPGFTALADRALARSGPGRGLPDLPLSWGDSSARVIGAPPRDPATVPTEGLLRVGIGVLADLLLEQPDNAAPIEQGRRRRPWTRQFLLAGAPLTVAAVRQALAAAGHRESHGNPEVVVVARPLDVHLFEAWTARVRAGASARWGRFVARCAGRDELPPSADLLRIARRWRGVVGPERVHLVFDPADPVGVVAHILGLSARRTPVPTPAPEHVDVVRRLNALLRGRVPPERRTALVKLAGPVVVDRGGQPLRLPPELVGWALERSARLREGLRADGYPVHGDAEWIGLRAAAGPVWPRSRVVLDLVLAACRALADQPTVREGR
ncbi:MAG: hypothetical protein ACRDPI_09335 [Nocardioidaceae bacterium]